MWTDELSLYNQTISGLVFHISKCEKQTYYYYYYYYLQSNHQCLMQMITQWTIWASTKTAFEAVTFLILLHFLSGLLRNPCVAKKHPQTTVMWQAGGWGCSRCWCCKNLGKRQNLYKYLLRQQWIHLKLSRPFVLWYCQVVWKHKIISLKMDVVCLTADLQYKHSITV